MKTIISCIIGLTILSTVMFAQNRGKQHDALADTIEYIRKETLGGKFDFRSVLNSPAEVIRHSNSVAFNKNDYHVFLWGRAVSDLGLESTDQAARLWEQIHGKKLTGPQRTALKIGFEKKVR